MCNLNMYLRIIIVLLVLSLTGCQCGILDWFSGLAKGLDPKNVKSDCRERREAEENEIKPDNGADKIVSLMDIEKGKPATDSENGMDTETHQGNPKAKRCPMSPRLGAVRRKLQSLPIVKRNLAEEQHKKQCDACRNRAMCKLLGKCEDCNIPCTNIAVFTNDELTPWTNQSVGMAHRMASPKKDDIFSKTLYPISTFKDGETKEILCRIVGIPDASDIETVLVWVTTYSNSPPKVLNGMVGDLPITPKTDSKQNLRETESTDQKSSASASPELKPRFTDYEEDDDVSKVRKSDKKPFKTNPDVIQGPPPFVGSNNQPPLTDNQGLQPNGNFGDSVIGAASKPIVVQPKEFESDESDEADDNTLVPSPVPTLSLQPESTASKGEGKPSLLDRLRDLTTSKSNLLSNLKGFRQGNENTIPSRGGFLKNLFKPRQDTEQENPKIIISTPLIPISSQEPIELKERVGAIEMADSPIKLPDNSENQMAKINEALQEVKSMVKNMQEEASKASETRLLGASHMAGNLEEITPASVHPVIPNHVADNLRKVNQYIINRAKDALELIGNKDQPSANEPSGRDEHSDITKDTITNFKKMPEYMVDRLQDTLNGFDNKGANRPLSNIESNSLSENVQLFDRFGDDDAENMDNEENVGSTNVKDDVPKILPVLDTVESVNTQPEQNILENIDSANMDTPAPKNYKNKLDKYLTELKEKRQRMFLPEKYNKSPVLKSNRITSLPTEGTSSVQNTDLEPLKLASDMESIKDKPLVDPPALNTRAELEKQRDLLKEKLQKFIQDVKLKTNSMPSINKADILPIDNIPVTKEPPLTEMKQPGLETKSDSLLVPKNEFKDLQNIENTDQVLGKSNIDNTQQLNNINPFLPTISTLPKNEIKIKPFTEAPNKFQKYLEDFRSRQSSLLKPKLTTDTSFLQNRNKDLESNNLLEDGQDSKKDLLKDKIRKYVESLSKPTDEKVGQPEISLNQRLTDQITNLNNKVRDDMKNLLGSSSPDIFKKDLLKDKLKKYIDSLKKPTGNTFVPDLMRKSPDAQREEIKALRKKLESLLKPSSPFDLGSNPLVSRSGPSLNNNNNAVPVINGANSIQDNSQQNSNSQIKENNPEMLSSKDESNGNQDPTLQSRAGAFEEKENVLDWSHNLGKIVQSKTNENDIFFVGTGIKLPLKVTQGPDGSMDLSVDLEKLCSCYNASCSKNHNAIEETVGAILEKEAELNNQLNGDPSDDVKIEPIQNTQGNDLQNTFNVKKSNVFKRSPYREVDLEITTIETILKTRENNNEKNIRKNLFKNFDISKLPSLQFVADEINNLGKKVQDSFTGSVQQLRDNVEELKEEMEDTFVGMNNPNPILNQDLLNLPSYDNNQLEDTLQDIREKAEAFNSDMLKKIEHQNSLRSLLNKNKFSKATSANLLNNNYLNRYDQDKILKKLIKSNGLDQLNTPTLLTKSPLKKIESQMNNALKNLERQNSINKLLPPMGLDQYQLLKMTTTKDPLALMGQFQETLKKSLPAIPELQEKINEINDEMVKITDTYQFGKANVLENRLNRLNNEIEEYRKNNEQLIAKETKKMFGSENNKILGKEIKFIDKILTWVKSLPSILKGESKI